RTYTVGAAETIGAHTWDALMYPPAASPYYQTQHAVGTFTVKGPSFIGQTTLSDWYWYYYLNRNVRIKIKNSANVVVVNTVVNAPYGNWEVPYSGPTGTYKVFIEPSHWLSQYVGSVAFTSTTYGSAWQYTTHENGDCNGDNIIDLTDYTQVVVAFNGIYGSAPYTDPADLNGDGVVDLTDYTVIITNFNHIGQQYGF
ncbi:MAG: dockerin type I repeat-containing protein, partial [Armatimonadetes bacterium]|nr:dockerin type I repeat-containing protein [Armatimonadota bacterium]